MENKLKVISPNLLYFPSSEKPLSADVFFIKGNEYTYIYDVGANEESRDLLNEIEKKKVILSHFHQDHTTNIRDIEYEELFVDKKTGDFLKLGEVVERKIKINDGVKLEIIPTVTSHSKTALLLNIDNEYLLTGDALYSVMLKGREGYNVQLLRELISTLKGLETKKVILSHDKQFIYSIDEIIEELESYYLKREKDNPYIFIY